MDGKCAAHVVLLFDKMAVDNRTCQPINYGMEFPFDLIKRGERVYIVDYSIEPEEMRRLKAITDQVIWIDHHKTAIEKYADFPIEIDGLRDIEYAGCELTWLHFSSKEAPEYVKLIGDRDTWTWQYGDRTKFFHAAMEAFDTNPQSPVWDTLQKDNYLYYVLGNGKVIQKYKDRTEQEYIKENGFEIEFHGHQCYAVNGLFSSQPFEAIVPDVDIWLTFRYLSDHFWMVSLYTNKDIDVSEIAKLYVYEGKRGGGHKQASGFECEYPPFMKHGIPSIPESEKGKGCAESSMLNYGAHLLEKESISNGS